MPHSIPEGLPLYNDIMSYDDLKKVVEALKKEWDFMNNLAIRCRETEDLDTKAAYKKILEQQSWKLSVDAGKMYFSILAALNFFDLQVASKC